MKENEITKQFLESNIKPEMNFAVFGDSRPINNKHYWDTLIDHLKKYEFVANVGDFTEWSWPWEYISYCHRLRNTELKMLHIIGNHDDRIFGPWCFKWKFGDMNSSIHYGNWQFIVVRNVYVLKYGISNTTYKWLKDKLETCRNFGVNVCIFTHVPPKDPYTIFNKFHIPKKKLLAKDKLLDLVNEYNDCVRLCFYGHAHLYAANRYNGVLHTISGGAALLKDLHECWNRSPYSREGNHATSVTINQDGSYRTELMDLSGQIINGYEWKN